MRSFLLEDVDNPGFYRGCGVFSIFAWGGAFLWRPDLDPGIHAILIGSGVLASFLFGGFCLNSFGAWIGGLFRKEDVPPSTPPSNPEPDNPRNPDAPVSAPLSPKPTLAGAAAKTLPSDAGDDF